jgi:hypothetical protein
MNDNDYTVVLKYGITKLYNPQGELLIELAHPSKEGAQRTYEAMRLSAFILNNERKGIPITKEMVHEFMTAESEGA